MKFQFSGYRSSDKGWPVTSGDRCDSFHIMHKHFTHFAGLVSRFSCFYVKILINPYKRSWVLFARGFWNWKSQSFKIQTNDPIPLPHPHFHKLSSSLSSAMSLIWVTVLCVESKRRREGRLSIDRGGPPLAKGPFGGPGVPPLALTLTLFPL